jgi:hypothetical protein
MHFHLAAGKVLPKCVISRHERVCSQDLRPSIYGGLLSSITVNDAYVHFCEYLSKRKMPPVNRKVFKHLVPPVVKEQFDLGIRNDLQDQAGDKWQRGWKGIGVLEPEVAVQEN